ncbi:MAG TPA: hypothetical protein VK778_15130 [Solirubrobacteraceae bacterium]|nr:hypothetical protein [Solirubrobacteraceae bacterium]
MVVADFQHGTQIQTFQYMRGDRVRFGWRTLLGVVLVTVVTLHGFDSSFVIDGDTLGVLGMLLVLALAGELESAKFAGFDVRFRRRALSQIEHEVDDLPPSDAERDNTEEAESEHAVEQRTVWAHPSLRSLAREDPKAAVLAFLFDVESDVRALYDALMGSEGPGVDVSFGRCVDVLTRYGVTSPSEARILLDITALRNSYVHGHWVDADEAARLLAVGARVLPSLRLARRRVGQAFERRVGEVLESVPGLAFEREPRFVAGPAHSRPDFLITAPKRYAVEAKLAPHSPGNSRVRYILSSAKDMATAANLETTIVVVPAGAGSRLRQALEANAADFRTIEIVSIDSLKGWLEDHMKPMEGGSGDPSPVGSQS